VGQAAADAYRELRRAQHAARLDEPHRVGPPARERDASALWHAGWIGRRRCLPGCTGPACAGRGTALAARHRPALWQPPRPSASPGEVTAAWCTEPAAPGGNLPPRGGGALGRAAGTADGRPHRRWPGRAVGLLAPAPRLRRAVGRAACGGGGHRQRCGETAGAGRSVPPGRRPAAKLWLSAVAGPAAPGFGWDFPRPGRPCQRHAGRLAVRPGLRRGQRCRPAAAGQPVASAR
jgi:hypothetical protein